MSCICEEIFDESFRMEVYWIILFFFNKIKLFLFCKMDTELTPEQTEKLVQFQVFIIWFNEVFKTSKVAVKIK